MSFHTLCHLFSQKKLPNPVFARLLKEVAKRDEIIKEHLNNYKVSKKQTPEKKRFKNVDTYNSDI